MKPLEISNPRICKFYLDNPTIDIEAVNLTTIDLIEKMTNQSNSQKSLITLSPNSPTTVIDIHQPFFSIIQDSENRINSNINIMQNTQTRFISEMNEVFGKLVENHTVQQNNDKQLSSVLTKMYNSAEVHNPNKTNPNSNGLILLKRNRKSNILIDNKDTEENVSSEEVQTFLTSIDEQNCNGIFISQKSGISGKKNYQIEMHNNNIIVFIHHGDYNQSKIEAAVDIIDQLSSKMRQYKHQTEEDCIIPKEMLDTINNEYQLFLSQKTAVVDVFKESQKKVLAQIDEIRFPTLDKYLATKYSAPIQKPGLKCDLCKSFSANNLKALAAHKRGCIRKQTPANVSISVK
jgi:hypothetical protein